MSAPILALTDIDLYYTDAGERLHALDRVSLTVDEGEFVALIGPSGSGKSTLLDVVSGLYAETSGTVAIEGMPTQPRQRLGRSAYMRQRDLLMPWRTALDNAALALEVRGTSRSRARDVARQRFAEFGLDGFEERYPSQLSGGMRQRVAFLRTALTDQRLLLLDEPFGALDALNRVVLQTWLTGLWERERQAVVFVTHDVDEAIFLADRVVVLSARPGTIVHEEIVSLARPRQREMVTSDAFLAHRARLLDALGLLRDVGAGR